MKNKLLLSLVFFLFSQHSYAQQKIKPDLKIMNFLGKSPYKTESNAMQENLMRILYFRVQPENKQKIGFINTKGEIIIKPTYDVASDFYGDYANIIKDSIYGYVDKKGTEVLFSQYKETYFYYGNIGIANKNGKFGLIDRKGNPITDFLYNQIYFYGFNHFKVVVAPNSGHILDNNGDIIFNQSLGYNIQSYHFTKDSLLVYEKIIDGRKLQGLVDLKGSVITEPKYTRIFSIENQDLYVVSQDKKYGFINKSGFEVIPVVYDQVASNITEGLIAVKQKNKWGFITKNNVVKIPFEYDEAYPFFEGLAFVKKGSLYQGIDTDNTVKVTFNTPKSEFPFFSNNLCLFKKDGKYGYINKKGEIVIPAIYEYAYPFVNNMAYVESNGKTGFINKNGKEIIPIKYSQLWLPSEKLIKFVE